MNKLMYAREIFTVLVLQLIDDNVRVKASPVSVLNALGMSGYREVPCRFHSQLELRN